MRTLTRLPCLGIVQPVSVAISLYMFFKLDGIGCPAGTEKLRPAIYSRGSDLPRPYSSCLCCADHTHSLIDIVVWVLTKDDNLDIIKGTGIEGPACTVTAANLYLNPCQRNVETHRLQNHEYLNICDDVGNTC